VGPRRLFSGLDEHAPASPWVRLRLPLVAAVSLAAVGAALLTQHVGGMLPCPWCVLQRLIFLAIAAAALLGSAGSAPAVRRTGASLALLLSACGVATALWQHVVANESQSCAMSLADRIVGSLGLDARWPEVFAAYASCAEAKAWLLGVPYEFYSLALFVGLGAAVWPVLRDGR
jgi:disulfide bond formation protein DsbB